MSLSLFLTAASYNVTKHRTAYTANTARTALRVDVNGG